MNGAIHLEGARVTLDSFTQADIGDAYVGWLNDPEVVRFSNQRFRTHSAESCRAYLASFAGSDNLFLAIRRREDGAHIGTMTVYRSIPHGTADVGIMVGERGGGGYGQDAWDTLLGWLLGRGDIRKVTAGTLACNTGMVRLMQRSGMTLEGTRRAQELVEGEPQDIVLYGKFAP